MQLVRCHVSPSIYCLQEYDEEWLKDPGFAAFWESVKEECDFFAPRIQDGSNKSTLLLMRKQSLCPGAEQLLKVSWERTKAAEEMFSSEKFRQELLKKAFESVFQEFASEMLDHAVGESGFLDRRFTFAVCDVMRELLSAQGAEATKKRSELPLLVISGHALADGSDNRAMALAAKVLAESQKCDLLMAFDANCLEDSSDQTDFLAFLDKQGIRHCFSQNPDVNDPKRFHTSASELTWCQPLLHLAGIGKQCTQDFVLAAGAGPAELKGVRVNSPQGLAQSRTVGVLPDEASTWKNEILLPNKDFCSDHVLILASVEL
eukprot:TRINITY_DN40240_c0_g1_i1.p1 TRINITY_DN40240_c0_g1~~TRINITY_DN40240_c0_g1_i1.p1  ORF type:complete len:318 (-),score=57.17 TRINITY_DN40240_c0_g1_i1:129-1082(-)